MSSFTASILTFVCIFGGAMLGLMLRGALPQHHMTDDSKDVIKVAVATIATLAALVLGLLVSSAKNSFDSRESEVVDGAARLVLLDRTLAAYGPETKEIRDLLRQAAALRLKQIWPETVNGSPVVNTGQGTGIENLQRKILELSPKNDIQQWAKTTAVQITGEIAAARWLHMEQMSSLLEWPFLVILILWLVVIFGSFGLFAPRNGTVIAALFLAALSMAGCIYLVLELDQPYSGSIKISSLPLRMAIDQLGQ
jgi:hypothetical protein